MVDLIWFMNKDHDLEQISAGEGVIFSLGHLRCHVLGVSTNQTWPNEQYFLDQAERRAYRHKTGTTCCV